MLDINSPYLTNKLLYSPSISHDSNNGPGTRKLNQLLMPAKKHTHLLSATALTEIPSLNLRKPGTLRRNRFARGLGTARRSRSSHSFVTEKRDICKQGTNLKTELPHI